ncbi:membrane protein permease, partial [Planoprotostelium fungivorum]
MNGERSLTLFRIASAISCTVLIACNALYGQQTGETSKRYPTPITPAPYTFSIWSVVFILSILWSVFISFSYRLEKRRPQIEALGLYLPAAWFLTGVWPIVWNHEL